MNNKKLALVQIKQVNPPLTGFPNKFGYMQTTAVGFPAADSEYDL